MWTAFGNLAHHLVQGLRLTHLDQSHINRSLPRGSVDARGTVSGSRMCSYMSSARPTGRRTCVRTNPAPLRFTLSARKASLLFTPVTTPSHNSADTAQALRDSGRSFQPLRLPLDCLKYTTAVLWRSRPTGVDRRCGVEPLLLFFLRRATQRGEFTGQRRHDATHFFSIFSLRRDHELRHEYPNIHDDEWHALC